MADFIKINPTDNVIIALKDFSAGEIIEVDEQKLTVVGDVPKGHKIALTAIAENEDIIKYGAPIGHATQAIEAGEHIHVQNLKTNLSGTINYSFDQKLNELAVAERELTFEGYKRSNGKVGIRNELWIVPTVGCVNGQAQQIIDLFKQEVNPTDIDGVEVFKHSYGCSQLGDDHVNTQKALADVINHPNAGGVFVLGLGCENNQIDHLKKFIGDFDESRVRFLASQDVEDEVETGLEILKEIYEVMHTDKRETVPLSDFLVAQGGTTILTEVPEMFGAETLLMERAQNKEVFDKTVSLINDFKAYYLQHNLPVYENPSPGNKKGGISTLEDKSLGCTQKGGTATVVDVLKYAEPLKTKGLNLLSAPGNDLVAASALGFSGCQMVLFTTGRGTPFGSFVPTMKISTNSDLFNKKKNWIDFNAGTLLEGKTMDEVLEDFVQFIIEVASGKQLNHEKTGFKEIAIFKTGVTL